jgi:dethiobiotin synthetase
MQNMIKGIFITGTDTGVGKTYIAAGIASSLRRGGVNVGVMKPVETGCPRRLGRLVPSDTLALMKAAQTRDALGLVNPCRFLKPLAPSVAAKLEGKHIDPAKIIDSFLELSRRHDFMIVEGAGGIMVPISRNYLYLDLAAALRLPVIIVARPGLGTINHTLLTISAIRSRGIIISGVVINYAKHEWKKGLAERTCTEEIKSASGVRVLGEVPYGRRNFNDIVNSLNIL